MAPFSRQSRRTRRRRARAAPRAPASAHTTAATDFLLIRTAGSAALQLREITGTVLVGQQHPAAPVWAPGSQDAVRFEESRLQVRAGQSWGDALQPTPAQQGALNALPANLPSGRLMNSVVVAEGI
jgi:hypothetical protein